MEKNIIKYPDDLGNKVTLQMEADGDFNLNVKFSDSSESNTLITKQDFERMKYLEAVFVVKYQKQKGDEQ